MDEDEQSETKTIEEWATSKGFLPETRAVETRLGQRKVTVQRSNPDAWKFTAAKAARQWPEGKEVTEEEFDDAVKEAAGVTAR